MIVKGIINGEAQYIDVVQRRGMSDYVVDGTIVNNAVTEMVLVSGQADLNLLTDYSPGTIAYTAGYQAMWQKAPDGTWASFE